MATSSFLSSYFPRVSTSTSSSPSPSEKPSYDPLLTPPREGESIRALHARCTTLLSSLLPTLAAKGCKKLVLFSHAATVIALSRAMVGDVPEGLLEGSKVGEKGKVEQLGEWEDAERLGVRAATCSVSKFVRRQEGEEGWEREWDGRTDFLERGEERRWDFTFVGSSQFFSLPLLSHFPLLLLHACLSPPLLLIAHFTHPPPLPLTPISQSNLSHFPSSLHDVQRKSPKTASSKTGPRLRRSRVTTTRTTRRPRRRRVRLARQLRERVRGSCRGGVEM